MYKKPKEKDAACVSSSWQQVVDEESKPRTSEVEGCSPEEELVARGTELRRF